MKKLSYVLVILLVLAIGLNIFFIVKLKRNQAKQFKLSYKEVLTTQECNVFELMHQQYSNKEIAAKLFVSISTIKTHINNIYSKLSIRSRKEINQFFE